MNVWAGTAGPVSTVSRNGLPKMGVGPSKIWTQDWTFTNSEIVGATSSVYFAEMVVLYLVV